MTVHQATIIVIANPRRSVIECTCGEFEKTKQGSGPDIDERLLQRHAEHAAHEPPSTGVEVDKTGVGCSFQSSDEGQTGWVACHDGQPPNDGDYLILPNGNLGNARYKVVKVKPQRDPMNMWIADVRHAPSTKP